jgi:hypothetical protein
VASTAADGQGPPAVASPAGRGAGSEELGADVR